MNKIPKFFRKRKTQSGEEIQSPTKDILTPAELEKLRNKIVTEITIAELRIAYILNRQDRPKHRDKKEIEEKEADIRNLRTKYQELLDPEVTVYVAKKQQAEPLAAVAIEQNPPINPRQIKENRVSDLFDYRPDENEARAAPLHIEELTSKCISCRALVTYSVHAQRQQCSNCKAEIQPKHASQSDNRLQKHLKDIHTNKVEKEDVTEEKSLLQDFLEDEEEYLDDEQEPDFNHHEEQNNNEHIYDAVNDQSDDENQQVPPIFFGHLYHIVDVEENQIQPYIPHHFFDDEMALTQAAVNAWRVAVDRQAAILETGLGLLNAQTAKKEIPNFTGEIEGKLAIEEWFKIAERIATNAGWTEAQKLRFFQERMVKSAENFNDSLTAAEKATYQIWKTNILNGLADNTTKARKKEQLKDLKQEDTERVRDFKIRIDDYYKIAFGIGAATSANATVVALRDEAKKDVLLNGLKPAISDLVWNRPNIHNATYAEAIEMAEECEKIVEIKKIAKSKDLSSAVTVISKENEKNAEEINNLKDIIKQMMSTSITQTQPILEQKNISALNRVSIAKIDGKFRSGARENRKIVRFRSNSPERSRSQTPNNRSYSYNDNNQGSNWGNQKLYESRRCYICEKKGHLARQCWRANQNHKVNRNQNVQRNGQREYSKTNRNNGSFRNETGRNGNN